MLRELDVLVLDCQATGATPAHGELLELGWGICASGGLTSPARAHWIAPRTDRGVSRVVRKLTGWDDDCLSSAVDAAHAWSALALAASHALPSRGGAVPTVIHFARFELPFLRELHAQAAEPGSPFPFDAVCLHAIAQRLYPDLPRRNLRALAGHLGFSPELVRRSAGHVEASAHIWRAIVPELEKRDVGSWSALRAWLDSPARPARPARSAPSPSPSPSPSGATAAPRSRRPGYPLPVEKRRALPDGPGVYRFLRPNGDVLYVGKAASLKRRVASHFTTVARATERALEMLSQAHDLRVTPTETALEAALLEADEIKRIDPPYNVQLRSGDRRAWFASRDWMTARAEPDDDHRVGPLPSRFSLSGLAAVHALACGAAPTDLLRAAALGVPPAFASDAALFDEVWRAFAAEELGGEGTARARVLRAASRIVVVDPAPPDDELAAGDLDAPPPSGWDAGRVRRSLARTVVTEGLLVRRARVLSLLCDAVVTFREPREGRPRRLVLAGGEIIEARDAGDAREVLPVPEHPRRPPARHTRQSAFDAARYDRLRVLATELRRVVEQGGEARVAIGMRSRVMAPRLAGSTPAGA